MSERIESLKPLSAFDERLKIMNDFEKVAGDARETVNLAHQYLEVPSDEIRDAFMTRIDNLALRLQEMRKKVAITEIK